MVKSMTGYGRAVETVNGREFTVEVRSVNNRYLDCTVKLPRGLSFGEDAVKQAVKATISRGKVDVFVSVRSEGAGGLRRDGRDHRFHARGPAGCIPAGQAPGG